MFNLGDVVWLARASWLPKKIQCPDCFGKRFLRVIMGDNTEVTVDCPECIQGFNGSQGVVGSYDYEATVEPFTITGLSTVRDGEAPATIRYSLDRCNTGNEQDVFACKEAAGARALVLAKEMTDALAAKLTGKHKPNRTWAWNATYHRGCIRKAEKDIAYHKAKLAVALLHKGTENA